MDIYICVTLNFVKVKYAHPNQEYEHICCSEIVAICMNPEYSKMTVSMMKDERGYAIHILPKMYVMYGHGFGRGLAVGMVV